MACIIISLPITNILATPLVRTIRGARLTMFVRTFMYLQKSNFLILVEFLNESQQILHSLQF